MAFNFWHSTDKYVKPVDHKNGIGFVNIDIWGRFSGGGEQIPHMIVEFSRRKFNTIISRATNRAGEKFRTEILRKTAEQYYVRLADTIKFVSCANNTISFFKTSDGSGTAAFAIPLSALRISRNSTYSAMPQVLRQSLHCFISATKE